MPHMKYLILVSLFISSAYAGECRLTGFTSSCEKLETKFELSDLSACENLARQTKSNKFFNFMDQDDRLVQTQISFKNGAEIQNNQIEFIESVECI